MIEILQRCTKIRSRVIWMSEYVSVRCKDRDRINDLKRKLSYELGEKISQMDVIEMALDELEEDVKE